LEQTGETADRLDGDVVNSIEIPIPRTIPTLPEGPPPRTIAYNSWYGWMIPSSSHLSLQDARLVRGLGRIEDREFSILGGDHGREPP